MPPAGDDPGRASLRVVARLLNHEERTGIGQVYSDGTGFHVNLPHREALSPDAAYHIGPPTGREFPEGDPIFAVEIPSKSDYGPAAEQAMAEKRADYFACGTLSVWDVDLQSEEVIKSYPASDPDKPVIFRRGEIVDAEPAVQGWRMAADELFG